MKDLIVDIRNDITLNNKQVHKNIITNANQGDLN